MPRWHVIPGGVAGAAALLPSANTSMHAGDSWAVRQFRCHRIEPTEIKLLHVSISYTSAHIPPLAIHIYNGALVTMDDIQSTLTVAERHEEFGIGNKGLMSPHLLREPSSAVLSTSDASSFPSCSACRRCRNPAAAAPRATADVPTRSHAVRCVTRRTSTFQALVCQTEASLKHHIRVRHELDVACYLVKRQRCSFSVWAFYHVLWL